MEAERTRIPRPLEVLVPCVLAFVAVGLYLPGLGHDFVGIDDAAYVTDNLHVRVGLRGESIRWAFTAFHAGNWHPLTWLSHMLDCELFGLWAGGHHLTSALLHGLNAVLLFLFLRLATRDFWASALVAALFAWHPLRVESVAWIAERKDVLSGTFWMTTLLAYLAFARKPSAGRYALVLLCFLLGLMAKPMLVTLPFVLLLMDVWPLGRWRPGVRMRCCLEKVPFVAVVIASSLVTIAAQDAGGALDTALPLGPRIGNALVSCGAYLGQSFWPTRLAVYYPHPVLENPSGSLLLPGLAFGALVAATSISVVLARRRPYLAVGWAWYLGTLVPVLGIVQVGSQAMADRYTYLPLIGIALALAWCVRDLAAGATPGLRRALVVGSALVLACIGFLTWRQVGTWKDTTSVFQHALAVTGENVVVRKGLGLAYLVQGELDQARAELERAHALAPADASVLLNLGIVELKRGEATAALTWFERAIREQPLTADAHYNAGLARAALGDLPAARASYERALELDALLVDAMVNLGETHLRMGDPVAARKALARALELDPGLAPAHHNLALAAEMQGEPLESIRHLRKALVIDPELLPSMVALAWILATSPESDLRNGSEALRWARVAAKATAHRDARVLDILAAAQAESGAFAEAVEWQTRAIELAPERARDRLRARLELYRLRTPFRQPPR